MSLRNCDFRNVPFSAVCAFVSEAGENMAQFSNTVFFRDALAVLVNPELMRHDARKHAGPGRSAERKRTVRMFKTNAAVRKRVNGRRTNIVIARAAQRARFLLVSEDV